MDKGSFEVDGISLTFFPMSNLMTSNLMLLEPTDGRSLAREALVATRAFNRMDAAGPESFCSVSDKANRRATISARCDLLALGSSVNAFASIAHTSNTVATPINEMVIM